MSDRIKELDYLKCVFIVLMIIFHLVYISELYPYIKSIVYTFHMSAFLVISGYLAKVNKTAKSFFKGMGWIFVPYAFMEVGYVFMSFILPVREKIYELSPTIFLIKIFVNPLGPYWYLHTLLICSISYFIIYKLFARLTDVNRIILLGLCLFALSYSFRLLFFGNVMYFIIGVAIYQSGNSFTRIFQPSSFALLPLIWLCSFPENLDRSILQGVVITYLVISFLLYLYGYIPERLRDMCCFIGENTLIILFFSPIFTILSKVYLPLFSFDPSGICFICVTVLFVLGGCIAITYAMDKLHISPFFFGRKTMLTR